MGRYRQQVLVEFEIEALDERDARRRVALAVEKIPVALIKGGFTAMVPGEIEVRSLEEVRSRVTVTPTPTVPTASPPLVAAPQAPASPVAQPVATTPRPVPLAEAPAPMLYGNGSPGGYVAADANGGHYRNTLTTHTSATATVAGDSEDPDGAKTALEAAAPELYTACEKVAESCAIVLRSLPLPSALADHLRLVEQITRGAVEKAQGNPREREAVPLRQRSER